MTFRKSTRYALYATVEMARAGAGVQVTVAQVAERYRIPVAVLAKVFQQLVRAGIAVGTRGTRGGYSLSREPSRLTVLDVIEAFEPLHAPERCLLVDAAEPACEDHGTCRLGKLFDEVNELARCTYGSVTLETLVGNRSPQEPPLHVVR
jgi:Rrf2 family protein